MEAIKIFKQFKYIQSVMKSSFKGMDEQEEAKDYTGGALKLMRQRVQLEDADRRTFLKNSTLANLYYDEEKRRLQKGLKEVRDQLRKQKVLFLFVCVLFFKFSRTKKKQYFSL